MRTIPTQEDGLTSLSAENFNQIPRESENAITSSGQNLDATGNDVQQLGKAMANYSCASHVFSENSFVVNTYELEGNGSFKTPHAYQEGLTVTFKAALNNTGASTCSLPGLEPLLIVQDSSDTPLEADQIGNSQYTTLICTNQNGGFKWRVKSSLFDNAVTEYGVNGDYFPAGGTSSAIVLITPSSRLQPKSYVEGMKVRFKSTVTNSGGGVTCKLGSLAALPIYRDLTQEDLYIADIISGSYTELTYSSSPIPCWILTDNDSRKIIQTDGGSFSRWDEDSIEFRNNTDSTSISITSSVGENIIQSLNAQTNRQSVIRSSATDNGLFCSDGNDDFGAEYTDKGISFTGTGDPSVDTSIVYRMAKITTGEIDGVTAIEVQDSFTSSESDGDPIHRHRNGYCIVPDGGSFVELFIPNNATIFSASLRYKISTSSEVDIAPVTFKNIENGTTTQRCSYISVSRPVDLTDSNLSWSIREPDLSSSETYLIITYDGNGL